MSGKGWSGLLGVLFGGAWLIKNVEHFNEQGFTAIGMPVIILVVGAIFLFQGIKRPA